MIIKSESEYQFAYQELEQLIAVKFEGITESEARFSLLANAVARYEKEVLQLYPIRATKDISIFLTSLMKHKKLKNNDLSQILQITEDELSSILQYRKPFTFEYAERLKKRFGIEAPATLQAV
jgi:antitoxin component HigA of HigAB toxin-antitoxin module